MTAKLNQIIAVEKGIKSRAYADLTTLNKSAQKPDLFLGFTKTYTPKNEEGEQLPGESRRVQLTADDVLRGVHRTLSELFTIEARKEWTNVGARADVTVDGVTIVEQAPVTFLLFLEKQLNDVKSIVSSIPILSLDEAWKFDAQSGLSKTEASIQHRTKKVEKPIVLYPATDKHPAQTALSSEDVIVGFWHTVKQSGAVAATRKRELLERIDRLAIAVKEARETANSIEEAHSPDVAKTVFSYLFA